jgi:hypothetical protein
MIEFKKPTNLNGAQLLEELNAAGITVNSKTSPLIDGQGKFWLDISATDESKAKTIVAAHNGTVISPEQTIDEKLASVGLSLDELKAALA